MGGEHGREPPHAQHPRRRQRRERQEQGQRREVAHREVVDDHDRHEEPGDRDEPPRRAHEPSTSHRPAQRSFADRAETRQDDRADGEGAHELERLDVERRLPWYVVALGSCAVYT